ncbi:MAG: ankyrin repeat domain-containing protein, partial [Candidatus Electrothrix sp. AR3]|nr:ankyrin repeat domain-containing protein [Candidatus Electrothrix sp. AR3]
MIHAGNTAAVQALVEKGADLNAQNSYGDTPLMIAARYGYIDIIQVLLNKGADVDTKNKSDWTALMLAARYNHADIVQALLDKGADIDLKNKDGWTALSLAEKKGHNDVLQVLSGSFVVVVPVAYASYAQQQVVSQEIAMDMQAVDIPPFPWPPPKASAFEKIPSKFLSTSASDKQTSLKDVAEKLEAAFGDAGYSEKKYYQVPDGFALVSKLEQFHSDGTPKEQPDRWAAEFRPPRIFSLKSYIKSIFTANPGRYRIVVFIVTSQPFESEDTVNREEAMAWLDSGIMVLPKSIGDEAYTD